MAVLMSMLSLVGCRGLLSINDLHHEGRHTVLQSSLPPKEVALCMQRNGITTEWAYLRDVDEFIISNGNGGILAQIEVRAEKKGQSLLDIYYVNWYSSWIDLDLKRIKAYCS